MNKRFIQKLIPLLSTLFIIFLYSYKHFPWFQGMSLDEIHNKVFANFVNFFQRVEDPKQVISFFVLPIGLFVGFWLLTKFFIYPKIGKSIEQKLGRNPAIDEKTSENVLIFVITMLFVTLVTVFVTGLSDRGIIPKTDIKLKPETQVQTQPPAQTQLPSKKVFSPDAY